MLFRSVSFGGVAGTSVTVVSPTSITVTSPASTVSGKVDVTVTNTAGTSSTSGTGDDFTYTTVAPAITSLSPTTGVTGGNTLVTITGTGFLSGATVSFGGTAGTSVTVVSATSITVRSPATLVAGKVDVSVTTSGGTSANTANDDYTYTVAVPTVTSLSPATGSTVGGTSVTITGTGFTSTSTEIGRAHV